MKKESLEKLQLKLGGFKREIFIINRKKSKLNTMYIAHALGKIDETIYTNSIEAFEKNYLEGYRYFEGDLQLLEDGRIVLFHDKKNDKDYWIEKKSKKIKSWELEGFKYNNKYKVIELDEILEKLKLKKDFYLILDTKFHTNKLGYLNKKVIKILEKLKIDYRSSPFFIEVFKKAKWKLRVETSDGKIFSYIYDYFKGEKEYLGRLIPQVNI